MTSAISGPVGMSGAWSTTGASAPMPPQTRMSNLFDTIDQSQSGVINKSQLSQAFQTLNPPTNFKAYGADKLWNALDPNKTGSVSKADFVPTMTGLMSSLRGYAAQNPPTKP